MKFIAILGRLANILVKPRVSLYTCDILPVEEWTVGVVLIVGFIAIGNMFHAVAE